MTYVHSRALPAPSAALETRLALVALVLFALLIRLAVIAATVGFHAPASAEPASDSRIHIAIVERILAGQGYSVADRPTAMTPPLYIFFLAAVYRVFDSPGVLRLIQAALGALGIGLIYAIGRRLFNHRTGIVAAIGLALHPLVAYLSGLHLTENLFLLLVMAVVWQSLNVAERPSAGGAAALGALAGLAALTRSVFLAFLPVLVIWALGLWGVRAGRTYRLVAIIMAAAALAILPWTVRNYLVFGEFVPIQSNAGMVLWAGNNPHADGGMVWPTRKTWSETKPPDDGMYGWNGLTIGQENARYVNAAMSWIRAHPGDFLALLGKKLTRLYGFARATDEQGLRVPLVLTLAQLGLYAAAAVGLVLSWPRRRPLNLLLWLMVFTNLTVLVFSGATRYLVPMLPSLLLFAAAAVDHGWERVMLTGDDA